MFFQEANITSPAGIATGVRVGRGVRIGRGVRVGRGVDTDAWPLVADGVGITVDVGDDGAGVDEPVPVLQPEAIASSKETTDNTPMLRLIVDGSYVIMVWVLLWKM